jgi:hypothetical protein
MDDLAADIVAFLDAVEIERATLVGLRPAALSPVGWQLPIPTVSPGWCSSTVP